jgi:hypothetical protein
MPVSNLKYYNLFLLLLPLEILAQTGTDISPTAKDTSKTDIATHSFYSGAGYGSNMIYLGSTISQNQPYGYGSLTYGFKNQLYASVSAVHLSGLNPFLSFYIGALNYSHVFNNWFDISAGVSRYQVVPSLVDTLFNSFTYGNLTLGFDWKLLYSKISAGGLFSTESQVFFQFRNSRYFQTPELFKGKANISFDPYVNLLLGTVTEVETNTETTSYYSISSPYRKWRNNGRNSTTSTTYTFSDRFGLLEMDFGLPVAFNTDFMTIEVEPLYVIPFYDDTYYLGTKGFILQLSIFFRFF